MPGDRPKGDIDGSRLRGSPVVARHEGRVPRLAAIRTFHGRGQGPLPRHRGCSPPPHRRRADGGCPCRLVPISISASPSFPRDQLRSRHSSGAEARCAAFGPAGGPRTGQRLALYRARMAGGSGPRVPRRIEDARTNRRLPLQAGRAIRGKPIGEYEGSCVEGRALQVMIDNNLDFAVALYPYRLHDSR